MTWFYCDQGFSMTPLTGLVHEANGTTFCGKRIDNNDTERRYWVTLGASGHAVTAGLEGTELYYGDDIDTSHLAGQGEEQLAGAVGVEQAGGAVYCDTEVPVSVVRDPSAP
jgi:hypothetical protein